MSQITRRSMPDSDGETSDFISPDKTLFVNAIIITMDSERRIILDGAILVIENRIAVLGKTEALLAGPLPEGVGVIDLKGEIVIPGLINTHAHVAQSLLRGLAEDLPLHNWLCDAIWPLEANYEGEDGYVAARLTIAEMLKSGTTCFLEAMLTHRSGFENVARAVEEMGIRACLGKLVKVEETNKDTGMVDPRDRDISSMSIESVLAAHDKYHGSCNERLKVWMAAGTPRGSPASAHKAIGDTCEEHGIGLTMHCAEAPKDLEIYRQNYDCSPVEFCRDNNLIGKGRKTVLAHMVNLDLETDLKILHESEAAVAHNPASNCKLASGIAAVPEMLQHKVNVSLGTDGAPCNNTYDMLQEMRLASLIHKGNTRDASVVNAYDVLQMATIDGARALGLEEEIGSLEVGKKADFVSLDYRGLNCAPFDEDQILEGGMDPVTTVVYSCTGRDVSFVLIDGRCVVRKGKLESGNEQRIKSDARKVVKRLRDSAGIKVKQSRNYR